MLIARLTWREHIQEVLWAWERSSHIQALCWHLSAGLLHLNLPLDSGLGLPPAIITLIVIIGEQVYIYVCILLDLIEIVANDHSASSIPHGKKHLFYLAHWYVCVTVFIVWKFLPWIMEDHRPSSGRGPSSASDSSSALLLLSFSRPVQVAHWSYIRGAFSVTSQFVYMEELGQESAGGRRCHGLIQPTLDVPGLLATVDSSSSYKAV